ncbi:23S rRNA (guanosine-2'-O-)-methyltransferase RlmB [Paraconexibacter sp. AEG42_29]|uniref:23S rRNA (Guanosine-2'-O-)-methyltransferase RlmB n=1 Tax=Paraconexibacter sp. AEG42_29 TaxID=2997339 RepID=A0AAU7AUS5_9ACTN
MITSPQNAKLKEVRRLARPSGRSASSRFVAEGEDLVVAAEAAGWTPLEQFVTPDSDLPGVLVEPELLNRVSALGSGSRVIAVYEQRWAPAPAGPVCVALWGVGDPGNVGTVLRSALAFGAQSVALGPGCADPFSPKAVRASMGAVFAVPLARVSAIDELPAPAIALAARTGDPIRGPQAGTLVIGAERAGLPDDVLAACAQTAHIPISGSAESLNAAMAATVGLYEMTRNT